MRVLNICIDKAPAHAFTYRHIHTHTHTHTHTYPPPNQTYKNRHTWRALSAIFGFDVTNGIGDKMAAMLREQPGNLWPAEGEEEKTTYW